jgi:predicted O-methyltransferase YrrM
LTDWPGVLGCDPDEYCDRVYHKRPAWAVGTISHHDARFLFGRALCSGADVLIEVGTASGLSTVFLCHAAERANAAGLIGPDFQIHSYDIDTQFYADRNRRVGDGAREMLADEELEHITFHAPATAAMVRDQHDLDSIEFAFIDAAHKHPWPALDLLAMLACLRPGADVLLHDINLPRVTPEEPTFGAKLLFDELDVEKEVDRGGPIPNIGSIRIPDDKSGLREQLTGLIEEHEWEVEPPADQLRLALA